MLWETTTGVLQREFLGHKQGVYGIAFTMDGRTLASACHDGTVKLWHITTGRELVTIELDSLAMTLSFSPDDRTLAAMIGMSPYIPEELKVWQVPSFEKIEEIEAQEEK